MTQDGLSDGPVVLTGGTRGVGLAAARLLAAQDIPLVLGVRDIERGLAARRSIRETSPTARVELLPLDLASLGSVREFAARYADGHGPWSRLVLNAGVINHPRRELTGEGFEMHFGVNHLGHFALAGLLMPLAGPTARVITQTSIAARMGVIQFHDLRWDHGYRPFRAYAASKRANLVFAAELQRRLDAQGSAVTSVAVHPGYAVPRERLDSKRGILERAFAQDYTGGAGPLVAGVTRTDLSGGELIAPGNRMQTAGAPRSVARPEVAEDELLGARLWRISGQLTRIPW